MKITWSKLLFQQKYTESELTIFEFLSKNELFQNLSYQELSLFTSYIYTRQYQKHEVVFFRNDPSRALYLIKKGIVALSLDMQTNFEVFTHLTEYKALGISALLANTRRTYNAIVESEECELIVIPQVNIFDIFKQNPIIKAKMLEALSQIYHFNTSLFLKKYRLTQGFFEITDLYKEWKHGE
ncbi:MAG: cyclic nucleotide-binding domain-containing protein [Microscillaceae bacterium]|nr:cyclic nucleotide-binding domain-containing protein [Microscillaceae bacterium]MDW8461241.1 cyclic nucleotide-binding domain-containing protein [Cytophagales bacterium]